MRWMLVTLVTGLLLAPGPATAATFTVTKTADTLDGACDADCSLREAVAASNVEEEDVPVVADTIVLPAGTYPLTLPDPGDDTGGGDLDVRQSATLVGAGARSTVIQAGGTDRVLELDSRTTVEVSGVTLTGGGGVGQGAGLFSGATLSLHDAAIVGNATTKPGPASRQAGGVFLSGPTTLERVLVAGNSSSSIAGDVWKPQGAGIFVNAPATLVNVTIAGNTIDGTGGGSSFPQGAGLFANDPTTLVNVTLAGNRAVGTKSQGAGIFFNDDATVQRTIVAGNATDAATDECFVNSVVITSTANLATDAADCAFTAPGDLSADPLLAPLADTGGPTDTRAPGPGSPALDRAAFASCPALDQRGFPRQGVATGAACDLGAHEAGAVAGALPPPAPPPPPPPAPAPPPAPPKLTVASVLTLPPARRCVSRRAFRIRLRAPKGVTLQQATVLVNGRRARVVRGRRLTAPVDLRGLPKGRFTVKVTVTTTDGRRVSDTRRYRTCAPRRRGR